MTFLKAKKFEVIKTVKTIKPPIIVFRPGYSLSMYHASIGARIASNSISKDTSEEEIKRGPVWIKQTAIGVKKPPKIRI